MFFPANYSSTSVFLLCAVKEAILLPILSSESCANTKVLYKNYLRLKTSLLIRILRLAECDMACYFQHFAFTFLSKSIVYLFIFFLAYSATFLILYLHIQLTWAGRHGAIPKLFIEVLIAILALYCGLTRISDYKHHPTDVVIGLLLGIFIGVIVSMCILNRNRRKETYDKIDKITITSENAIPALVL